MSSKSLSKDFTTGSIPKQLLGFTFSFMLSNALLVLYSTVDMAIVGKFVGTEGLSAVSQSSQIINFAIMLTLGFSNAGQVLISQALGAGKRQELNKIIGTLFTFVTVISVALSVVMVSLHFPILKLIKVPDESFSMAVEYLIICGVGFIFAAGYNLVSAVLRGMGDAKRPLLFIGIATAVNIVFDLLFTGALGFGVAGAAWATVLGQAASFLFSIYYLFRHKESFGFDFRASSFRMNGKTTALISKLGTPMAIQSGFINVSMLFVSALINADGLVYSATFGAGVRIDDIINKISQGIQYAATPMISQNIGAGNHKRVRRVVYWSWCFSFAITAFFMLMYVLLGKQLFMAFSDDAEVHKMAGVFISAILWMFPAFAFMRGSGAFISGAGCAKLNMVLAMLDGVVLRIGLSFLFGKVLSLGFYGYVLGYALAPYGYAIPSVLYFLFGRWHKNKTIADDM